MFALIPEEKQKKNKRNIFLNETKHTQAFFGVFHVCMRVVTFYVGFDKWV